MQRTTYECDRCHKQVAEGDTRRGLDLPPRWRQVFEDTNLTYELCSDCGEAMHAFVTQCAKPGSPIAKAADEMAFNIERIMKTYIPPLQEAAQNYRQASSKLADRE